MCHVTICMLLCWQQVATGRPRWLPPCIYVFSTVDCCEWGFKPHVCVCVCFLVGDFFISLGKGGTNSASGKKTARFRTGVCNTICMLFVTSYVQTRLKQKAFQGGGKMNIHTFSKNEPGSGHHEQPGFWHDRGFSHNQYFITCDLQNKSLLHCFWVFAGLAFCTGNKVFVAGALPVVIGGTSYLAIECQTGLSFHDPPISKILHIYIYIYIYSIYCFHVFLAMVLFDKNPSSSEDLISRLVRGHCQGGTLWLQLSGSKIARVFPEQKCEPVGPYSIIMHYIGIIIYFCILIFTIWDSKEIPRCSIQRSLHSKIGIWILQDLLLPRSQDTSRPNVGTRFCIHTVHRFPPKPDVWKTKKINLYWINRTWRSYKDLLRKG